MFRFEQNF